VLAIPGAANRVLRLIGSMKSEAKSSERRPWATRGAGTTKRRKYGGVHTSGKLAAALQARKGAPATAPDKVTCEAGRRAPGVACYGEARRRPSHLGPRHGRFRRLLPSPFSTIYCSDTDGRTMAPWEAVNYSVLHHQQL
jgi:hypothetical protein